MTTKTIFAGLFLLLAASCSNDKEADSPKDELVPVRVHVADFSISMEDLPATKATTPANYFSSSGAITLAFYTSDGTEKYKTIQIREDATTYTTFGEFTLSLPKGNYTMVVIGCGYNTDDVLDLTSPTSAAYTSAHVRETLVATQSVNLNNAEGADLNATLSRIVAKVQVLSTDTRTAEVANIRTTFSAGSKGFNPTTGFATDNAGFSNTVMGAGAVGETTTATSYLFLAQNEQTMDVIIETLNADGAVLFSKTITNVPLKRNRVTKLTGAMYSPMATSVSLLLNTEWEDENCQSF